MTVRVTGVFFCKRINYLHKENFPQVNLKLCEWLEVLTKSFHHTPPDL